MFEVQRATVIASLDASLFAIARADLDTLITSAISQTTVGNAASRATWVRALRMIEHVRDVHLPAAIANVNGEGLLQAANCRFLLFDLDVI